MEQFKFRGWDTTLLMMFNPLTIEQFAKSDFGFTSFNQIKLMQYIGREDDAGNSVYESDIVKIYSEYEELEFIGVVKFGSCSFYIESDLINGYRWQDYDVTILGNIYENKELLEEK